MAIYSWLTLEQNGDSPWFSIVMLVYLQIGLRYIHVQPPTNLLRKQQSLDKLGHHFLHSHSLFTIVITSGWSPWLSTPLAGIIYIMYLICFHSTNAYKQYVQIHKQQLSTVTTAAFVNASLWLDSPRSRSQYSRASFTSAGSLLRAWLVGCCWLQCGRSCLSWTKWGCHRLKQRI